MWKFCGKAQCLHSSGRKILMLHLIMANLFTKNIFVLRNFRMSSYKKKNNFVNTVMTCRWYSFFSLYEWHLEVPGIFFCPLFNPSYSFLPAANLNLNYFWTACGMNLKLYDFSLLLLEIILLEKKNQKIIKISESNIFLYRGYCQK